MDDYVAQVRRGALRLRLILLALLLGLAGAALVAGVMFAVASFGLLGYSIDTSARLDAQERIDRPARFLGVDPSVLRAVRRRLGGADVYYLDPGSKLFEEPFVRGAGPRNLLLYALYPAVAVDDPGRARIAVGVADADLTRLGVPAARITRIGPYTVGTMP